MNQLPIFLAAFSLVTTFTFAEEPLPVGDVLGGTTDRFVYAEPLSDEFDGERVDAKKWNVSTEDWGTWSWEPENAILKDGSLNLQMVQQTHRRGDQELAYTSGIARSRQTVTYGYFEARIKGCELFPGASPAFWLHSKGPDLRYTASDGETVAYSEIDVIELQQGEFNFETKSNNGPKVIDCNLHNVLIQNGQRKWQRPNTHPDTNKNEYHASFDPRDDFHVYAVENNKESVIWYIDGQEIARKPNLYWHLPMHVTVSLGLRRPFENYRNGQRVAELDKTTSEGFPTTMFVDYVRVWKNTSVESPVANGSAIRPIRTSKPDSTKGNSDWDQSKYVAMEKAKWESNGWPWDQERVEANFGEIDTDQNGVASGQERQAWYKKKSAAK